MIGNIKIWERKLLRLAIDSLNSPSFSPANVLGHTVSLILALILVNISQLLQVYACLQLELFMVSVSGYMNV